MNEIQNIQNYVPKRNMVIRFILFGISIALSILLGYLLIENAYQFTLITIIITILLLISMYLYFKPYEALSTISLMMNNPLSILLLIFILSLLYFIMYFYYNYYLVNSSFYFGINSLLDLFLIIIIIVLGLTLIYVKYRDSMNLKTGHNGILIQILFFIPCLITDFMEWLRGESKITPSSVFILLIIEILLIIVFFNISTIMKWLSNHDPINHIMPDPVFLIQETKVMSAENFNGLIQEDGSGNKTVKQNYSLGFWVYLNDNTGSNQSQLPVLCYGGGNLLDPSLVNNENPYGTYNVHPAIVFLPKKQEKNVFGGDLDNVNIGHLGIYFSNVEKPEIINVPLQRWNYVVLNWSSSIVDVFLNGEMVYTKNFIGVENPLPIYNQSDYITIGGNNLQGSIKDIMYCDYPLSNTAIVAIYNMNMFSSKLVSTYMLR